MCTCDMILVVVRLLIFFHLKLETILYVFVSNFINFLFFLSNFEKHEILVHENLKLFHAEKRTNVCKVDIHFVILNET